VLSHVRAQGKGKEMTEKIPFRNHSPYGWWIATYVLRDQWDDNPNPSPKSRCTAWENTIILQAADREAAYEKAVKLASGAATEFGNQKGDRTGRWVFEGLMSLLPIYEELEDGTEILWTEHENKTVAKVRSWVRQKHELEVFDDTPAIGDSNEP
jgi:uncharacterized protein DUF4288